MKNNEKLSTTADGTYAVTLQEAKQATTSLSFASWRSGMTGKTAGKRHSIVAFLLTAAAMVSLLAISGCNDSDSDPALVLEDATWVAFQDGDGTWEEIEIPADMVFDTTEDVTVNDPDGRYGLAIVVASAEDQTVQTITLQTTTAEIPSMDFRSLVDPENISLEVTVEESSASWVNLYVHDDDESVWNTGQETFNPYTAPYDLVATLPSDEGNYPSEMIVRSFDASDQTTVDFDTDEDVFELVGPETFTYDPVADFGDNASMDDFEVYLRTANNTLASLGYESVRGSTSVEYTCPADLALEVPGANYLLELDIDIDEDSSIYYYEGFSSHGSQILDIPSPFDGHYASDTTTGSLLPGMTWTGPSPDDAVVYAGSFEGEANGIGYRACTLATAGRQAASTSLVMPDLSSVETWFSLWSIPTNAQASYTRALVVQSSESITDLFTSDLSNLYLVDCPPLEHNEWIAVLINEDDYESPDL